MAVRRLTKEQLEHVIKMQLLYERNSDIRHVSEIVSEIPGKAAKSIAITTSVGSALTFGSSLFVFRKLTPACADLKQAVPVLAAFSALDFGVNFTLTKGFGKRVPERWMSVTSGGAAGATLGYVLGKRMPRPTILGGIAGALYGLVRNYPLEVLGFEPF
jgi:hypothetical protein